MIKSVPGKLIYCRNACTFLDNIKAPCNESVNNRKETCGFACNVLKQESLS